MRQKNKKKQLIFTVMLALGIMACGKDAQTDRESEINPEDVAEAEEDSGSGTDVTADETAAEPEQETEQETESEQTLPDNVIVAYVSEDIEYVDEVIPVQYTDDLSLLADMKYTNSTYAYQDGKVYYRRYHEDSYKEAALYGDYDAIPGTKKEMVCVDADGTVTELFTDYGDSSIHLVNNRFYLEELKEENTEYGYTYTSRRLYSVDMQGNDRIDYGEGYFLGIDKKRKIIIMELEEESGTYYHTINYETGERERFSEHPASGYRYDTKHADDYTDGICKLCAVSSEGEEREIIALTSDGKQNFGVTEHILDVKVDGDRIYFIFGGYDGQLRVFQGGKLISVKLDGTDYKAVETHTDNYYICHDEGKTLVYFSKNFNGDAADGVLERCALVWDVEEDICYCSEFPARDLFYYEEMGSLYSAIRYDDELQRRRTDIYAIPDDSGRIVRVAMDIEQYITKWEEEEAEYIDYEDFYFADGVLYFKVEYKVYDAGTSLGWRDGYRRLHIDICRLKIGESKAEVLYSY